MMKKDDWKKLLEDTANEFGADFEGGVDDLALYAAARTDFLATIAGLPGFEDALVAERDSIALRAGIQVHDLASAVDQRMFGIIAGALRIGAKALAGLA